MRLENFEIRTRIVQAELDDAELEALILQVVARKSNVHENLLREHGRLRFELSDAGTPEIPRWSVRFDANIPLPVEEGR